MGFCPQCRADDALVEASGVASVVAPPAIPLIEVIPERADRLTSALPEVDRVLGGGVVPGSAILVGGEPGVGKSTLLLQLAAAMAAAGSSVLLATAEESAQQVASRARRLGAMDPAVHLVTEADVDAVMAAAVELRPQLLVVDSIQTVQTTDVPGAPGSVAQVRECAGRLVRFAKDQGIAVVLVGHVTKDGGIAGPKVLEHVVDVVLYLEGEAEHGLRLLRCWKNRFGATHVVGLFEMGETGLSAIDDPSRALVGDWRGAVPGTVVFPAVEGRRPLLLEIQALVSPTGAPQPRRSVRGVDPARVHQLLAVLRSHAGLSFGEHDVYVSVVGGVRVREPGADLPVALALASSLLDRAMGPVAAWGEVGLTGEVRPVRDGDRRHDEAARLRIDQVVAPSRAREGIAEMLAAARLVAL
jgi:DNA repair protein RadA/Sms